jgi:hypothetical protein
MPFDATPLKPIDRLIEALRGPEPKWWDFASCQTCAYHVGTRLGLGELPHEVEEAIGVSGEAGMHIFVGFHDRGAMSSVRPRHVADALEHYKLTGEAKSPFHFVKR